MAITIDHFDRLTDLGVKVIPLKENSKAPAYKGWNVDWSRKRARNYLERFPDANIGILLGDVIDVEGDSEEANETIKRLIGKYPHPTYRSFRSVHHLFSTPDPKLSLFKVNEIEFRGRGHQSVLPPSSIYGFKYQWLRNFQFPIPPMPEPLLLYLKRYQDNKKPAEQRKPGHIKVGCAGCGEYMWWNRKRHRTEVEVFRLIDSRWLCPACRVIDIRAACRMIKSGVASHQIIINALQQF